MIPTIPAAIWCVGRNFRDHAREMSAPVPQEPLIFLKAGACLQRTEEIYIPESSEQIDHEIELALKLDDRLQPSHLALALDLTARDWQTLAKKNGLPWTQAKSFRGSCPVSEWIPYQGDTWFAQLNFQLRVNGQVRQRGSVQEMIFPPAKLLLHLKKYFPLSPGDILLTGTPAGVGPLGDGDQVEAQCGQVLSWLARIQGARAEF